MREAMTDGKRQSGPLQAGWHLAYCAALFETDPKLALARIEYAEELLLDRLTELRLRAGGSEHEAQDLSTALTHLGVLHQQIEGAERYSWD